MKLCSVWAGAVRPAGWQAGTGNASTDRKLTPPTNHGAAAVAIGNDRPAAMTHYACSATAGPLITLFNYYVIGAVEGNRGRFV